METMDMWNQLNRLKFTYKYSVQMSIAQKGDLHTLEFICKKELKQ